MLDRPSAETAACFPPLETGGKFPAVSGSYSGGDLVQVIQTTSRTPCPSLGFIDR